MASILKVDTIQDQDGNNIINESANTITIGASGDTITIPSGATLANSGIITGFESTGIDDNATSTAITIDSGERVGIGTTNIPERLSISSGTGSACFIQVTNTDIGESDNNGLYLGVITDDLGYVGTRHNASLIFETNDAEAMRIDTSGNVGIGDTTPSAKLDVRSQINVTNVNGNSLQAVTGTRYGYSSAYRTILLGSTGTGTSKNIAIGYDPSSNASGNFAGNGTEILFPNTVSFMTPNSTDDNYIRPVIQLKDGTVGIGESTPLGKFHIRDGDSATTSVDSLADELVVENSGSGGMTILTSASSTANIFFGDPNNNSVGRVQYSHSSNAMLFATNGSEAMRIDSSGNVGIGTSSPSEKLQINTPDSSFLQLTNPNTGTADNNGLYLGVISGGNAYIGNRHSGNDIIFQNDNTEVMRIKTGGNVGIGTSSPSAKLHVDVSNSGVTPNANADELFVENSGNAGITIGSGTSSLGLIYFADSVDDNVGRIEYSHSENSMRFWTNDAEGMRIDSSGDVMINTTSIIDAGRLSIKAPQNDNGIGIEVDNTGGGNTGIVIDRTVSDGDLISFVQAGSLEGTISVSGSTVSYNGFTGTHWSRFTDNSKPTILKGTVLESLDEMCDWYNLEFDVTTTTQDEDGNNVTNTVTEKVPHVLANGQSVGDVITYNHEGTDYQATIVKETDIKHIKSKVSDTVDAKNVYGVFNSWDENGEGYNDFYVASVGSFVVRIKANETIAKGDLLQSNGDGTAKVQTDDAVRSSSFAKVLSTTIIETYEDGSYLVPCSLMC